MSLKNFFIPAPMTTTQSAALLLLRVVAGIAFVWFGSGKIQNPFAWMGPQSTTPGFLQALAALSEFGGGLAWILGLLTPLAAFGIACTMAVASHMHAVVLGDPFVSLTGASSWNHPATLFAVAVLFMALGPGKYSLDRYVFKAAKP